MDDRYIYTYTGRQFWPLEPRAQDVCIEDIAHALSMKCRFTGHSRLFYSVAEHCCRVHDLLLSLSGGDAPLLAWALMHDSAEAYLPDIASPIKHCFKDFFCFESEILAVVAIKFKLPMGGHADHRLKWADLTLLSTEARDLFPKYLHWGIHHSHRPLRELVLPWTAETAKTEFLDRWSLRCPNQPTDDLSHDRTREQAPIDAEDRQRMAEIEEKRYD